MKVTTAEEMRSIDHRATVEYAIPPLLLMENAGLACLKVVLEMIAGAPAPRICILAGKGNNGGDGLVLARHLYNMGLDARVYLLCRRTDLKGEASLQVEIAFRLGMPIMEITTTDDLAEAGRCLGGSSLAVDALLGTGLRGEVSGLMLESIRLLNAAPCPVLAIDIPSGLDADSGRPLPEAVRAEATVALALPKPGLLIYPGAGFVGRLTTGDIGIPRALLTSPDLTINILTEREAAAMLPRRSPEAYKNSEGLVLVIGGAEGMAGAAAMTGMAVLRAGAGMTRLMVPHSQQPVIAGYFKELMVYPVKDTCEGWISPAALPGMKGMLGEAAVAAVGPGMTRHHEALQFVTRLIREYAGPLVIDADALYSLPESMNRPGDRAVLTPHPGEMAHLLGITPAEVQADRQAAVKRAVEIYGAVTVLKGARTLIAHPDGRLFINPTGNPGMATGGSGDVLTGIIAALIAQRMEVFDAAVLGVYLHGLSGDLAARDKGIRSLIAGDIIDYLPAAYRSLEELP